MPEFTTQTNTVPAQRGLLETFTLTAGQTIASKIQALIASTPPVGSSAEQAKDYFTRTCPVGKQVTVKIMIGVTEIVDA